MVDASKPTSLASISNFEVVNGAAARVVLNPPSNITAGQWKVGIVVDDKASDEQAQAIERIVSGQAGGPFAEFAPLIGDYTGMTRGAIEVSDKGASIDALRP